MFRVCQGQNKAKKAKLPKKQQQKKKNPVAQ
jgi:hypothetical protein